MKVITWLGLCWLLFGPACQAANFAGNDTGSVSCPAELVDTVVERLGLPDLGTDLDQGEATPLVASTCKADPAQPGQTYVALAYDEGKPDTKTLILAIVERNRVLADYRGEISEDATLTLQPDSLRIDTAPYRLAKGVRAFGLDLSGWQSPNCGDGGTGPTRSLYIREGKHIRPVLTDLFLSSWRYIAQGQGRCNPMAPEDAPTIIEEMTFSVSVLPSISHGFHDLRVTAMSSRDGGKPSEAGGHWSLKYNGRQYPQPNLHLW
jgi:hypothetical protein